MHICLVSTEYPPESHLGGIATFMQTAGELLAKRGHRVSVVSIAVGERNTYNIQGGVYVWRVKGVEWRKTLSEHLQRNQQVYKAVQELKPDVVQLSEYNAEGFLLTMQNRRSYGIVTRLTTADLVQSEQTKEERRWPANALKMMANYQVRHSDALFAPSVKWAHAIEREAHLKKGSIRQIVTGIDLERTRCVGQAEPTLKIDEPYLVYFGRLQDYKGVGYLAKALPLVWEKFPDMKVVFVGKHSPFSLEGKPARNYVVEQAGKYADNLIFTDHLPRHEALPLVARARLAVLPSVREPYAHTCLECLVLGVPLVTTSDSGGNVEIVAGVDDKIVTPGSVPAGWLVPRQNVQALAEALIAAWGDDAALAAVKQRAALRAARFDANLMVDELEKLYNQVAK